jgi:protoporphyrinogen/coproporphyrinogen III oxidase
MPGLRIAIVGGGIAGLSAAYELEKARVADGGVSYTLFESGPRLGGVLATDVVNGAVLERGPDSFITEKPAAAELCRELGLAGDLIPSNDAARKTWIVVRNRLVPLPDGLMFLVPTRLVPTATTRLFGLGTKIRMGLELLHPPRPAKGDESVASLVQRHYGRETVDRLADPLLSGIYGGDSTQLSAQTVLPRLVEMERQYGSLTRGMLAAHKKMKAHTRELPKTQQRGAPAIFTTLRGGMQQLVDALETRLEPAAVRRGTAVSALERTGESWRVVAGGEAQRYDGVIVAAPAWAASKLLSAADGALGEELAGIPYSSSITVNLVYDERQLGALPEGFGFLVPANERRAMLACTFVHRKFLGRTPPGKAVLRAFLGGARNEDLLAKSDAALIETVRRELSEIVGARTLRAEPDPEYAQVSRWRRAMAQYAVGHKERVERIRARVAALPGLRLAGNAYDGIGVPDCIRLGRQAARELMGARSEMQGTPASASRR